MELNTPYITYSKVDVSAFLPLTNPDHMLWPNKVDDYRSNTFETHRDTRSILFSWTPRDKWPSLTPERSHLFLDPRVIDLYIAVMQIVKAIKPPLNMMLAELKPKGEITLHRDIHPFFAWARRIHVPIVVPKDCIFEVDNSIVPVQEGLVFELANTRPHKVRNNSDEFRYHIVMDFEP